jgi:hypothetical protein
LMAFSIKFFQVATTTRISFSFKAPLATSTKEGITSYFLNYFE